MDRARESELFGPPGKSPPLCLLLTGRLRHLLQAPRHFPSFPHGILAHTLSLTVPKGSGEWRDAQGAHTGYQIGHAL